MKAPTRTTCLLLMLPALVLLAGCHGARPGFLGVRDGRLAPCPATRNCVSSAAADDIHRIAPLRFAGTAAAAIGKLDGIVRSLPRASVAGLTETYLQAEFQSLVFRFVDDAEFYADESAGVIQVRSAARLGSADFGVNRRRIETIRNLWDAQPDR